MKSSVKLIAAFALGATLAGGIAVAEINNTGGVKACVDNKTKALYHRLPIERKAEA